MRKVRNSIRRHPLDTQNHFYGHTAALAAYAGLSRPRHVAGLIQHGWTTVPPIPVNFGDFPNVEKSGRRQLLVWSHGSRAWDPAQSPRQSFALGSPWAYLVSTDAAQRQVAGSANGAATGTLIMPLHSTRIVEVRGDQGSLAQEYLRDEGPSTVCLHAEDIHKADIVSSWLDAGHRVVTAGSRHDPDFLSRILALVLGSERVVANRLMTPVLYAASLGRDVAVYGDVATQRRGIQDRRHQPVGHNTFRRQDQGHDAREKVRVMSGPGRDDPMAGVQPGADDVRFVDVLGMQTHRGRAFDTQILLGQAALETHDLDDPGAVQRHDQRPAARVARQMPLCHT